MATVHALDRESKKRLRSELRALKRYQRYERKIVRALGHLPRALRGTMAARAMERSMNIPDPVEERCHER